jgi:hypothetical protein
MALTVTKSPPALIPPAGPTPGGSLPLSSIDKTAAVRVSVDFIQVFPADAPRDQAPLVATMREGFAKALVHYYPVAGRIAEPVQGEPVVECTGEGVWFVEADASCSLEEARNLERPLSIPKEELLPRPPAHVRLEDTVLLAQVRFAHLPAASPAFRSLDFGARSWVWIWAMWFWICGVIALGGGEERR